MRPTKRLLKTQGRILTPPSEPEPSLAMWKLLLAFVLSALCGCASSKDELPPAARNAGSHPPTFLTGAVSVLLTNAAAGLSAWVEMDPNAARAVRDFTSGQLLCSGSRLLFVPSYGSKKARVRSGGVTFIWDVAEARGIVMSESLQAFAPYTASVNPTNVVTTANKGPPQKIDGHLCESLEQVVQMSDGSARSFQVLRAADLKQVPLQISTVTNAAPSTVTLSKIRLETLSSELFAPPEGFTKYTSAEAMMDELAVRQGGLKRKSSEDLTLPEPSDSSYKRGR